MFLSPLAVWIFDRTLLTWIFHNKILKFLKLISVRWASTKLGFLSEALIHSHCSKENRKTRTVPKNVTFFVTVFYCWSFCKSFCKKGWGSQWKIFTSKFFKEIRIISISCSNPLFLYSKQERKSWETDSLGTLKLFFVFNWRTQNRL